MIQREEESIEVREGEERVGLSFNGERKIRKEKEWRDEGRTFNILMLES